MKDDLIYENIFRIIIIMRENAGSTRATMDAMPKDRRKICDVKFSYLLLKEFSRK